MLKGTERVNKIINDYLQKNFGLRAELGSDFFYDDYDEENAYISYALAVSDSTGNDFVDFCKSLNPRVTSDVFLLSLYHEIGHSYVNEDFDNDDWKAYKAEVSAINAEMGNKRETNFKYFNLPIEKAATEWALRYLETFSEEVSAFWNELQPAIMEFYKENEVA